MKALVFLHMALRRLRRRAGGQLGLLAALLLPSLLALIAQALHLWSLRHPQPGRPTSDSGVWGSAVVMALGVGVFFSANLIAAAIDDERRGRRSVQLRTAGIDGGAAVAGYSVAALTLALALPVAGLFPAAIIASFADLAPGLFVAGIGHVVAASLLAALPAVVCGYLLPRAVALVAVNAAAGAVLVATFDGLFGPLGPAMGSYTAALAAELAVLAVLAVVWRRTSTRLW